MTGISGAIVTKNRPASTAGRRNASVWKSLASTNNIPRPAHGVDQLNRSPIIDLGPQPADLRLDDGGAGVEFQAPDMVEQHGARDHPPGILRQIFQQLEFLRLEIYRQSCPCHRARKE